MIRRSTWIVLFLLVVLIGLSFYVRDRQAKELAAATPTEGSTPLFGSSLGSPSRIKVESKLGVVVDFSRDQDGKWVLHAPEETEADQAAAQAAATQVGSLRVLSSVDLSADIIGLDKPENTMTVDFGKSNEHTLKIGSVTPINDGYYVQLDNGAFQVVDKYGLDELLGLLTNPPYLATPTPVASSTPPPSATPSGEAGSATPQENTPLASTPTP